MTDNILRRSRLIRGLCVECGQPAAKKDNGTTYSYCEDCRAKHYEPSGTLCWTCVNAVPNDVKQTGCSWSMYLKPVEGWKAEHQKIKISDGRQLDSYTVLKCPKYKRG